MSSKVKAPWRLPRGTWLVSKRRVSASFSPRLLVVQSIGKRTQAIIISFSFLSRECFWQTLSKKQPSIWIQKYLRENEYYKFSTLTTKLNWAMALKISWWEAKMDFEYRKTVQILLLICLVFQQSSTIDSPPKGLEKEENESLSFSNCSTTTTADPSSCRCSDNLCLSEECILAASTVLSSLDRTADPCEDFYQFACGGWIQKSVSSNTDRSDLFVISLLYLKIELSSAKIDLHLECDFCCQCSYALRK